MVEASQRRTGAVARLQRDNDCVVFAMRMAERVAEHQISSPKQAQPFHQHSILLRQGPVAGGLNHRLMKLEVQRRIDIETMGFGSHGHLIMKLAQSADVSIRSPLGHQLPGLPEQRGADLIKLQRLGEFDLAYECAPIRLHFDKSNCIQRPNGFPNRTAAHPEALCEFHFRYAFADGQFAIQDHRLDLVFQLACQRPGSNEVKRFSYACHVPSVFSQHNIVNNILFGYWKRRVLAGKPTTRRHRSGLVRFEEEGMSKRELEGRVALVTGASRNIGRAIAVALGSGGASVLVHAARDKAAAEETAELVRKAGGKAAVALSDVATVEGPGEAVDAALNAFGRLDIVVANAAIRPEATIDTVTYEDWRRVMAISLDSVFLLTKAALPALRKSDQGAVVLIGGMTGQSGAAERIHVVAAKAGMTGFGKALAHDLGPDGITVNTVSPGLIETKRVTAEPAHHAGRKNPLGRRGTPEEIAAAVRMLAGPDARYITGQTLHVNGGALMV